MAGSRKSSRTTSEPPGSYELSWFSPLEQGRETESSYEPGGSDVVRELSREPANAAMFSDWIVGRGTELLRLQHAFKNGVFDTSKLVSLIKPYD